MEQHFRLNNMVTIIADSLVIRETLMTEWCVRPDPMGLDPSSITQDWRSSVTWREFQRV